MARYEMLTAKGFYKPCGQPVLSGDLPGAGGADSGYYFVYVLQDSVAVLSCLEGRSIEEELNRIPIRFGREFLLSIWLKGNSEGCFFELDDMTVADSTLQIHITPYRYGDTTLHKRKPWYKMADNYTWKVNGEAVRQMRIYTDHRNYAFAKGPRWSAAY